MNFIPQTPKKSSEVPYFDDVSSQDGWQGFSTGKSIDDLKIEISQAINRLGGMVSGFIQGTFQDGKLKREGFQIHYVVNNSDGIVSPGKLEIAALPVKDDYSKRKTYQKRCEQSLKMALYMAKISLDGSWFLQQLSPGYSPLMPWMIEDKTGKTINELWNERANNLLPSGDFEILDQ